MCSVGSVHVTTCPFNGQVHASHYITGVLGAGALGGDRAQNWDQAPGPGPRRSEESPKRPLGGLFGLQEGPEASKTAQEGLQDPLGGVQDGPRVLHDTIFERFGRYYGSKLASKSHARTIWRRNRLKHKNYCICSTGGPLRVFDFDEKAPREDEKTQMKSHP